MAKYDNNGMKIKSKRASKKCPFSQQELRAALARIAADPEKAKAAANFLLDCQRNAPLPIVKKLKPWK